MQLRAIALVSAASFACAFLGPIAEARAAGAWLSSVPITPVEQRVAIAAGPDRTTLWTSLRFTGPAATVGVVLPVPSGTALDFSSDAWFEALEVASAPRVLPPEGMVATCFDGEGGGLFEIYGSLDHVPSLLAASVQVLADAPAVRAWAMGLGLVIPPSVDTALGALVGQRFAALSFAAPAGGGITQTLRAVMPGAAPVLPLSLTLAGGEPLGVTAYLVGSGRGALVGSTPVSLPISELVWDAGLGTTNYGDLRGTWLAGAGATLTDVASHEAWTTKDASAEGVVIDSVVETFFARAVAYGPGGLDADACAAQADAAFSAAAPLAASCPRADLGVVDGVNACVEVPTSTTTDPALFRCGAVADDLAVALSGLVPGGAWLTRQGMVVAPGTSGSAYPLFFQTGAGVSPFVAASDVSYDDCAPDPNWNSVGAGGAGGSGGSESGGVVQSSSNSNSNGTSSSSGGSSGCDGSAAADGCSAAADGAEGCGEALGALGDLDCAVSRYRAPRASVLGVLLAALLMPLRRRGTERRRRARGL